jgi:RNA-directed DNA polymerase
MGTVGSQARPAVEENAVDENSDIFDEMLQRENLLQALRRVEQNNGAPGVDGMTAEELRAFLKEHWPSIRGQLLDGSYRPQPVRRVDIPKPGGRGTRALGIPTVLDRLLQQALLQVLQPIFDPQFSEASFGFRPRRSAHQAVRLAQQLVTEGRTWVVDVDLEKFFDRVNHDVLMARVARRVKDKRVLRLIRRYLQAGMMEGGLASPRDEGTPQGGPLSPLLSNILLDELDKELEQRGHRFVRYADDCNVYVHSEAAGQRVMASLERFLSSRLRLKVNRDKSAVARPWDRKFLGYTVSRNKKPKLRVAPESVRRLKAKLQPVLAAGRGRSLAQVIGWLNPMLRGWGEYFRLVQVRSAFTELDDWMRRKLRAIMWRQWKTSKKRVKELVRRGVARQAAASLVGLHRGPWFTARHETMKRALPAAEFRRLGLETLINDQLSLAGTT